ncbi:sperm microtubule inner protein 11 [Spinachia spinachia]
MAFFGVTLLGYQNPIGDELIVKASRLRDGGDLRSGGRRPLGCGDTCDLRHRPLLYSTDIHHGSHERYKEMLKLAQVPRSPDQLYVTPLTDSQQYGWMMSSSPEPWTQVTRFPRKYSAMTK